MSSNCEKEMKPLLDFKFNNLKSWKDADRNANNEDPD